MNQSGYLPPQRGTTTKLFRIAANSQNKKKRELLEESLAILEDANYGLAFPSCVSAVSTLLGCFQSGDHIICCEDAYWGVRQVFTKVAKLFRMEVSFVDPAELENIRKEIRTNTKIIWLESITNPLLKVFDIRTLVPLAKKHDLLIIVDNTFLTSYLYRPLDFGADLTFYSLTKYMNGHSDVLMGGVVTKNAKIYKKLHDLREVMGVLPSEFDCNNVLMSLRTLEVRMKQHSENSLKIALYLENHPKISKVIHPGLRSHPHHDLFKTLSCGHSGVVSFYLKGGEKECQTFIKSSKLVYVAESLGGYETIMKIPYVMEGRNTPKEVLEALQVTNNFVRLSVGLEEAEDIIEDLSRALKCI